MEEPLRRYSFPVVLPAYGVGPAGARGVAMSEEHSGECGSFDTPPGPSQDWSPAVMRQGALTPDCRSET